MGKNVIFSLIITILLVFSGCTPNWIHSDTDKEPQQIEVKLNPSFFLVKELADVELTGAASYANNFIICDAGKNCLTISSQSGDQLRTLGALGNGQDEFINPTGLDTSEDHLYVLDAGNKRIKIYDSSLNCIDTIRLDVLEPTDEIYYLDISVSDSGTCYVTTNSTFEDTSRIYRIDPSGAITTSASQLYGYTCCDGDTAYFINEFELSSTDKKQTAAFSSHYLYTMNDDGTLNKKMELPYKYGPADFIVEGNDLYVLSCAWARLDHFTLDGTYIETLFQFEDMLYPESRLARTANGFVVTDRIGEKTYFLSNE